jgi:hypothetical protein
MTDTPNKGRRAASKFRTGDLVSVGKAVGVVIGIWRITRGWAYAVFPFPYGRERVGQGAVRLERRDRRG